MARLVDIDFDTGFTVLTGETGAGKSIIIDSINMLLAGRVTREMIRSGENKASVSALFTGIDKNHADTLEKAGIAPDENGELYITRTINSDGRSSVKINNRSVPLSQLKDIGATLIAIHGQNDNRALLDKSNHLSLTDEYVLSAEPDAKNKFDEYSQIYSRLCENERELTALKSDIREKSMLCEILKHQIAEIDAAKLSAVDEEEKLEKKKHLLKNSERIMRQSGIVYRALASSEKGSTASYLIDRANTALSQLSDVIPDASELSARLESYRIEIIDIAERVREFAGDDNDETDPVKKLDAIESRLNLISKLKIKYGDSISTILAFRSEAAKKLDALESSDIFISELSAKAEKLRAEAGVKAAVLTDLRREACKKIDTGVCEALEKLDMPKVRFSSMLRHLTEQTGGSRYSKDGCEDIEFMIATNPGEPLAPLVKIASGGELSRIMLALKSVLSDRSGADTLIFDEVDTGISGKTSQKVGIMLKQIAKNAQTICVTHSAQIAAIADNHLVVVKTESGGRAESEVTALNSEERINEIARIIGGINITSAQTEAARQMLAEGATL